MATDEQVLAELNDDERAALAALVARFDRAARDLIFDNTDDGWEAIVAMRGIGHNPPSGYGDSPLAAAQDAWRVWETAARK